MLENVAGWPRVNPSFFSTTWQLITPSGTGPHKLTQPEFDGVIDGITRLMINNHKDYTVPGFEAGSDWSRLPWDIIYTKAAWRNERLAALMLGLMAQYAFIRHPMQWVTSRTTYRGHEYSNAYYFLKPGQQPIRSNHE